MLEYFDKNNVRIQSMDIIKHKSGSIEVVYGEGDDLGVNASNLTYMQNHGFTRNEIYPLYQFDTENDWEVIGHVPQDLNLLSADAIKMLELTQSI